MSDTYIIGFHIYGHGYGCTIEAESPKEAEHIMREKYLDDDIKITSVLTYIEDPKKWSER